MSGQDIARLILLAVVSIFGVFSLFMVRTSILDYLAIKRSEYTNGRLGIAAGLARDEMITLFAHGALFAIFLSAFIVPEFTAARTISFLGIVFALGLGTIWRWHDRKMNDARLRGQQEQRKYDGE